MAKRKIKPTYDELVKSLAESGARADALDHELNDLKQKNIAMSDELQRMDDEVKRWKNEHDMRDQALTKALDERDKSVEHLKNIITKQKAREEGILAALKAIMSGLKA